MVKLTESTLDIAKTLVAFERGTPPESNPAGGGILFVLTSRCRTSIFKINIIARGINSTTTGYTGERSLCDPISESRKTLGAVFDYDPALDHVRDRLGLAL